MVDTAASATPVEKADCLPAVPYTSGTTDDTPMPTSKKPAVAIYKPGTITASARPAAPIARDLTILGTALLHGKETTPNAPTAPQRTPELKTPQGNSMTSTSPTLRSVQSGHLTSRRLTNVVRMAHTFTLKLQDPVTALPESSLRTIPHPQEKREAHVQNLEQNHQQDAAQPRHGARAQPGNGPLIQTVQPSPTPKPRRRPCTHRSIRRQRS